MSSPIIESQNTLNSIIKFDGFNDDLEFSISTEVYEDLVKKIKMIDMNLFYLILIFQRI